jgi:lipopolysaccharide export system permease protein
MNQLHFFPSRTMALYVGRLFLVRSFAILFALVLVLQTLDLLGESGKILSVAGNSDSDVWRYVGLRLPQIIETFLPFSVLLGTILTLITLNQNSEVIAMKASGMSAHQVLAPLFLAALFVAAISFGFNERIVTRATAALAAWQKVEYAQIPKDTGIRSNIWVRDGNNLINAATVSGTGAAITLHGVRIYERSGGVLSSILATARGRSRVGGNSPTPSASCAAPVSSSRSALSSPRRACVPTSSRSRRSMAINCPSPNSRRQSAISRQRGDPSMR